MISSKSVVQSEHIEILPLKGEKLNLELVKAGPILTSFSPFLVTFPPKLVMFSPKLVLFSMFVNVIIQTEYSIWAGAFWLMLAHLGKCCQVWANICLT